jgi:hypothetical protein
LARKSAHSKAAPDFDSLADELGDKLAMDAVDRAYLARFTLGGNAALEREVLELVRGPGAGLPAAPARGQAA